MAKKKTAKKKAPANTRKKSARKKTSVKKKPAASKRMKPVTMQVADLMLDPQNVNQHDERSIEAIRRSIRRYGQVETLVVWCGIVIGGNGRLQAMQLENVTECDCYDLSHLSEPEARALAITLNQTQRLSHFDEEKLSAAVADLKLEDIDLDVLGFDDDELQNLLDDAEPADGEEQVSFMAGTDDGEIDMAYLVQVEVDDEDAQNDLVEKLVKQGFEARPLQSQR